MRTSFLLSSFRRTWPLAIIGLAGCADLIGLSDYYVDDKTSSTSVGGGTSSSSTTSTSSTGGGGAAPCIPSTEVCNGIDDDCDGVADEPDSGEGTFCDDGCQWLTFGDQLFAACPSNGASFDSLTCPAGMQRFVPQSTAEFDAVKPLLSAGTSDRAYLGLQQEPGGCDAVGAWNWDRPGMPIPWASGEPNDLISDFPEWVESGGEQCGAMVLPSAPTPNWVHDVPCDGFTALFLCEQIVDECVDGAPCRLPQGCPGSFDCALSPGQQCTPQPAAELCNGLDDNCDGTVDNGACGCTEATNPGNGKVYKYCTAVVTTQDTHCGPGFCPAKLDSVATVNFAESVATVGLYVRFGAYQQASAMTPEAGWVNQDGTVFNASLWTTADPTDPQPDDGTDGIENQEQQCAGYGLSGINVRDLGCTMPMSYLCEAL